MDNITKDLIRLAIHGLDVMLFSVAGNKDAQKVYDNYAPLLKKYAEDGTEPTEQEIEQIRQASKAISEDIHRRADEARKRLKEVD